MAALALIAAPSLVAQRPWDGRAAQCRPGLGSFLVDWEHQRDQKRSQKEIAETIGASQQVIAYHLKKLREQSKKVGVDDAFSAAILGGMAVGAGIGALAMLLEQLTKK